MSVFHILGAADSDGFAPNGPKHEIKVVRGALLTLHNSASLYHTMIRVCVEEWENKNRRLWVPLVGDLMEAKPVVYSLKLIVDIEGYKRRVDAMSERPDASIGDAQTAGRYYLHAKAIHDEIESVYSSVVLGPSMRDLCNEAHARGGEHWEEYKKSIFLDSRWSPCAAVVHDRSGGRCEMSRMHVDGIIRKCGVPASQMHHDGMISYRDPFNPDMIVNSCPGCHLAVHKRDRKPRDNGGQLTLFERLRHPYD